MVTFSEDEIRTLLEGVLDPEIPVINIIDLGILRGVEIGSDGVTVSVTPTYSGCPAVEVIERRVIEVLEGAGVRNPRIKRVFSPAWTTDWITPKGRRQLQEYGIAPPAPNAAGELVTLEIEELSVPCPFCGSANTELRSRFGSTACKAFHFCRDCVQPFETFKPI